MLGLPVEISVDINRARIPIHFEHKNICVHCGATGSLVFIDAFGHKTKKESVGAFEHIKCEACGRIYSMRWDPMQNDPNVYRPSAVEFNVKRDLKNLINSDIKHNGEKKI